MLASLWFLSGPLTAFVVLTARLAPKFSLLELLAASLPVAFIVSALLQFSLSSLTSALGPHTLFLYFSILAFVLLVHLPQFVKKFMPLVKDSVASPDVKLTSNPFHFKDNIVICAIIAVSALFLWPLYSSRMIPEVDGQVYSGGSCWSDLSIHMHIVYAFISGRNKDISWSSMHSPVFAGERFAYPFLPDFHAAVLVKYGYSMRSAFLWPGFLLAVAFCVLFYTLSYRITHSRLGSILGLILTICAGGVGAWTVLRNEGYSSIRQYDSIQDNGQQGGSLVWFGFLPHVLLPQRGANFAYPMVLFILSLIWTTTDMLDTQFFPTVASRRSVLILAAFLSACLPLLQSHAFLGLAILIGVYCLLDAHKWLRHRSLFVSWLLAGIVAVSVAVPQMSVLMSHVSSRNTFMNRGWWYKNHEIGQPAGIVGFFTFWWKSTGSLLLLFLISGLYYSVLLVHASIATRSFAASLTLPDWKDNVAVVSHMDHASPPPTTSRDTAQLGVSREDQEEDSVYPPSGLRHRKSLSDESTAEVHTDVRPNGEKEPSLLNEIAAGLVDDVGDCTKVKELTTKVPTRFFEKLDNTIFRMNSLTPTGRGFDAFKLFLASAAVFVFGNMYILQPWDRDNVKLFYLWVFIATMFIGQVLAIPFDTLLSFAYPYTRSQGLSALVTLLHPFSQFHYTLSLWLTRGEWSPPAESFPDETRVFPEPSKDLGSETSAASKAHSLGRAKIRHSKTGQLLSVASLEPHKAGPLLAAFPLSIAHLALIVFATFSGLMCIVREHGMFYVMGNRDMIDMGRYIRENVPPKSVMLHNNFHLNPSGTFGGRPSLISFTGWMWSHGYDFEPREADRDFILNHLLDENDSAYHRMRRWGVRYVVAEHLNLGPLESPKLVPKAKEGESGDANKESEDNGDAGDEAEEMEDVANLFANKHLKRLHNSGRYDLFEVLGYGFPPT